MFNSTYIYRVYLEVNIGLKETNFSWFDIQKFSVDDKYQILKKFRVLQMKKIVIIAVILVVA